MLKCLYCNFCFAAACITWELAESGKHFITTIINGSDLVPTFSAASVDDLRCEVLYFLHIEMDASAFILAAHE